MDKNKPDNQCRHCGAPMGAKAVHELCPACMLKAGFPTASGAGSPGEGFRPPSLETLARLFPKLEIMELIGRGGMGAVFKARQAHLDRTVALKILPVKKGADPDFAERFAREARALAKLNHRHIVGVYESGQAEGFHYFIMEHVDGLNLRQVQQAGTLSPREALEIVPQICEALQFAHDRGVVHRDIKPENVLLDQNGCIKIADFGLAKIIGAEQANFTLTQPNHVMGTPHYMAPEQVEHPSEVDHRADIYSLGVVFYELLTGELPLGRFAPPSQKVEVDVRLDDVVLKALEKEPRLRYQRVGEVGTDIQTIATTPRVHAAISDPVMGIDYRSPLKLWGLPLVHVATGLDPNTGRTRVARGVIAIGTIAQGVVAFGAFAIGGVAFGGMSIGAISIGGLAVGLVAIGGGAIGLGLAAGGAATGFVAVGGSVAGYYACGGTATGIHALGTNVEDPIARAFFEPWFHSLEEFAFILALSLTLFVTVGVGVPIYLALRGRAQQGGTRHRLYQTAILVAVVLVLLVAASVLVPLRWPRNQTSPPAVPVAPNDIAGFTQIRNILLGVEGGGRRFVDLDQGRILESVQDLPDDLAGRALTLNDLPWLRAQGIDLELRDGTVTLVDCSVAVMSSTTFDTAETRDVLIEAANARLTVDTIRSDAVVLRERDTSGPLDPQEAILRVAKSASPYFKTDCPNPDLPLLTRLDDHPATYAIQLQSGRTGLLYHLGLVAEDLVQVQYKLVASSPQFRATFANGVTVELLGLSYSPPDQQGWWSPAGSPLREAPPALLKAFPKTGERGYSLSVRFAGIGGRKISGKFGPLSWRTTHGGRFRSSQPSVSAGRGKVVYVDGSIDELVKSVGMAQDEKKQYCHIKVGICNGDWREEYRIETYRPNDGVEWIIFRNVALKPLRSAIGPKLNQDE